MPSRYWELPKYDTLSRHELDAVLQQHSMPVRPETQKRSIDRLHRFQRGQLQYIQCTTTELEELHRQRGLGQVADGAGRKKRLVAALEHADDMAVFKFDLLPVDVRSRVYKEYMADLRYKNGSKTWDNDLNLVGPPPIVELYPEAACHFFKDCELVLDFSNTNQDNSIYNTVAWIANSSWHPRTGRRSGEWALTPQSESFISYIKADHLAAIHRSRIHIAGTCLQGGHWLSAEWKIEIGANQSQLPFFRRERMSCDPAHDHAQDVERWIRAVMYGVAVQAGGKNLTKGSVTALVGGVLSALS